MTSLEYLNITKGLDIFTYLDDSRTKNFKNSHLEIIISLNNKFVVVEPNQHALKLLRTSAEYGFNL